MTICGQYDAIKTLSSKLSLYSDVFNSESDVNLKDVVLAGARRQPVPILQVIKDWRLIIIKLTFAK